MAVVTVCLHEDAKTQSY